MTDVSWARCGDEDCIRLRGVGAGLGVQVRPATAAGVGGSPPMAGRLVREGDDTCFVPRFAFVEGTIYEVLVAGSVTADLVRVRRERAATTEVLEIHPTATEVPRNLLRLYVRFSAPMREGCAAGQLRLVDDAGDAMIGALLPTEYELWDADHRRLTVLLDPARIKRGLESNRETGYPLRVGEPFRLVVDAGYLDAQGQALRAPAERRYEVGGDERRRVDPMAWALSVPVGGARGALEVAFDRPLDHGLLARCLDVVDPAGQIVEGGPEVGADSRSWRLVPRHAWATGPHRLVVAPELEDLAGNSVRRVFDRDLDRPEDDPTEDRPATVSFRPR